MILVDADACPVKREITEAALRRAMPVVFVSGQYLRLPQHPLVRLFVAGDGFDAADDAIAAVAKPGTLTVTADIPLAGRVIEAGGAAVDPRGREWTPQNIGEARATRDLMADLRSGIERGGGPRPYGPADRAAFTDALDRMLTRMARLAGPGGRR